MSNQDIILAGGTPGCGYCALLTYLGNQDGTGWKCKAFPDEIPSLIMDRYADHTKEYPGDNGHRYTPRIIKPEGAKVGYYYDWNGVSRHADTGEECERYSEVR